MTKFIVFTQVGEDVNDLKKKLTQVENDLIRFKNDLVTANKELEDKEKALTNVIHNLAHNYSHYTLNIISSTYKNFHFIFGERKSKFGFGHYIIQNSHSLKK
jgi:DNA repair exonuclease SbcCD ATPase subunit